MSAADLLRPHTSATVFEASGLECALSADIKPLDSSWRVCGPARTVRTAPGHNLWLHRAVYMADPGDVLVVSVSGGRDYGYWGEILASAAAERGLGGLVIDGCVRDCRELQLIGLPVFATGLCVRGTGKRTDLGGGVNGPVGISGLTVHPDDVVVGDVDGVVVVPSTLAPEVAAASDERTAKERGILDALGRGESTLDLYGWEMHD